MNTFTRLRANRRTTPVASSVSTRTRPPSSTPSDAAAARPSGTRPSGEMTALPLKRRSLGLVLQSVTTPAEVSIVSRSPGFQVRTARASVRRIRKRDATVSMVIRSGVEGTGLSLGGSGARSGSGGISSFAAGAGRRASRRIFSGLFHGLAMFSVSRDSGEGLSGGCDFGPSCCPRASGFVGGRRGTRTPDICLVRAAL